MTLWRRKETPVLENGRPEIMRTFFYKKDAQTSPIYSLTFTCVSNKQWVKIIFVKVPRIGVICVDFFSIYIRAFAYESSRFLVPICFDFTYIYGRTCSTCVCLVWIQDTIRIQMESMARIIWTNDGCDDWDVCLFIEL